MCMSPELLVHPNMSESEICGYSPGQGSPLPGETASPKSCFQQSPSLPDSGLTELNVASPKIYHPPPPPCKPPGMPAPAGKRKIFIPISHLVLSAPVTWGSEQHKPSSTMSEMFSTFPCSALAGFCCVLLLSSEIALVSTGCPIFHPFCPFAF